MAETNLFKKLGKFFGITTKKDTTGKKIPYPADIYNNTNLKKLKSLKMTPELETLYNYFLNDVFENKQTTRNRFDRYSAIDYAVKNNAIMSNAAALYADETVQADMQDDCLIVEAKNKKLEKYIYDFLAKLNITSDYLREVAYNLCVYGDSFGILALNETKGYYDLTPLDVFFVKDRIEFNAATIKNNLSGNNYHKMVARNKNLQKMAQMLTKNTSDYGQMFKSYTFGFNIEEEYVPVWNVAHFRLLTTQSEFAPFGRPILINSLSPYKQLQTSRTLQSLARAFNFPIKIFSVQTDDGMTKEEKWEAVNDAREEWANLGIEQTQKDQFSVNSEIWVPQGLIDLNIEEPSRGFDNSNDIEQLREELAISTRIPIDFLFTGSQGWGNSGQALLQQSKLFARGVFYIQTSILKTLIQIIKTHLLVVNDFDENEPFELKMPFPITEENSDKLRMKSDSLRLAQDVISNVGEAVGLERGEALPPEVTKDIYANLSFLDNEQLEKWYTEIDNAKEKPIEESVKNKVKIGYTPVVLQESIWKAKKTNIKDHVVNNMHCFGSWGLNMQNNVMYEVLKKNKLQD